jgi:hypothetical protein
LKEREAPAVLQTLKLQIAAVLDDLVTDITRCLPADEPPPAPVAAGTFTPAQLQDACSALLEQLDAADFGASHLFEQQEPLLRTALGERFDAIRTATNDFEFEAAADAVRAAMRT